MISAKIIKIASNTKYAGLKNIFTHKSSVKNTLCGDFIKIEIVATKTKIKIMRYETESCVLCEAAASLLANKVKNLPLKNIKRDIIRLSKLRGSNSSFPLRFKEFKHLIDKKTSNRINCVTLPIEAFLKAFKIAK
tara:strand:- start:8191 stop:8595 length:405 start_codon:yes stop_codon:yes gene_type:complete